MPESIAGMTYGWRILEASLTSLRNRPNDLVVEVPLVRRHVNLGNDVADGFAWAQERDAIAPTS